MQIDVRTQGTVKVIKLNGRLALGESVDRLRETIHDLLASGDCRMVVDLADVPMLDSSGIGLLIKSLSQAKQAGGSLKLLNPSKFALQTLRMIGLLSQFEVFADQDQAVGSFGLPFKPPRNDSQS